VSVYVCASANGHCAAEKRISDIDLKVRATILKEAVQAMARQQCQ